MASPYRETPDPGSGRERGRRATSTEQDKINRELLAGVSTRALLRRIGMLFAPHRRRLSILLALILASSLVGLAQPFLVRHVIDQALPNADVELLIWCVAAMIAIAAVTELIGIVQAWFSTSIGQQVMHRMRSQLFTHLQRQSLGFFTRTRGGEVQSRLINDVGGMQSVVTSTATSMASNVTLVVGTAAAMLALSWRLTLVSLIVLPPAVFLTKQVGALRMRISRQRQDKLADLHVQIEEGLSVSGILLTKTLGGADSWSQKFTSTSEDLVDLEIRSRLSGRWRMATMNMIFAAMPAALYLAAGLPATSGGMTIGTLVAFIALQGSLFRPLMSLLNIGVDVAASLALFQRVFEYADLPVEIADPSSPTPLATPKGAVAFENVSFGYDESFVLRDINLNVPAGSSLALVGATGSGKSTLASLVSRLNDPTLGTVRLDGIDLRELTLGDIATTVGVVTQETYLRHASVRDNLLEAKPESSEEELLAACEAARIHHVIESLPDGYDTIVGSRGHRFSGGEKQRIAIARTLLRNPKVLVLDEATSALDNSTEREVQEALDALAVGRTTITIAHRLSTVRDADRIAVLEGGRVAEAGTHEELLLRGGRYAELVRGGLQRAA